MMTMYVAAMHAGKPTPPIQRAWREKMGLVLIILLLCAAVGFLTFGFQQTVCGLSVTTQSRIAYNAVGPTQVVVGGRIYDAANFNTHPATNLTDTNIVKGKPHVGGMDCSFLFQVPNGACKHVLRYAPSVAD